MTRMVSPREAERLDALRRLQIVDTAPEAEFDAVCRLAIERFGVPIAYVAFIEADRQWMKAARGIQPASIPREVAFCARAILFDVPLIVVDAATDRRFADNPCVLGDPGIRFYAGVPLSLEPGLRIGTFCLIDTVPRRLSQEQIRHLQHLAATVVAYLRARQARRMH